MHDIYVKTKLFQSAHHAIHTCTQTQDAQGRSVKSLSQNMGGLSVETFKDPEKAKAFVATLPETDQAAAQETYEASKGAAGRDVLKFAVRFPLLLFIVFGAIALWFRARGGYKPIELGSQA